MSGNPIPLSPDDDPQQPLDLASASKPVQPYALTAAMFGLVAVLVLRAALPKAHSIALDAIALGIGVIGYLLFTTMRPRLPLLALSCLAIELGFLVSVPFKWLYIIMAHSIPMMVGLGLGITLFGGIGIFLGLQFRVDRYPQQVIALSFLCSFALINILTLFV